MDIYLKAKMKVVQWIITENVEQLFEKEHRTDSNIPQGQPVHVLH